MPTILVVDDEPPIIELMRDWLTLHRYDVITALDGHTAIRIAQEQHPDLVLLDVQMEGLSGIEVCRRLRSEPRTGNIPIILISGRDPSAGRVEGLMAGASDYVIKPVDLEDLNERMQLMLDGELSTDRSDWLLYETAHAAVDILPCKLAWVLTISRDDLHLVGRAIAAADGEQLAERFVRVVANGESRFEATLNGTSYEISDSLIRAARIGGAEFNLTINELRLRGDSALARASETANLQYISIVPLHTGGASLGVLVLGSKEPQDIQTTHGQQLLAAMIGQAATAADNARLVRRLLERESDGLGERSLYEEVINTMTDALALYDESGHITFANRRLVQMTGHASDALARLSVEDLCVPEDRERVQSIIKANEPAKNISSFEMNLLCADGKNLPVLAVPSGRTVARKEGVHERVLVLTDLSEVNARKQALVKQSGYLVALNRASQAASSADSLNDALQIILNEALSALKAQVATVLLRPPDAQELFCHTAVGPYAEELRGQRLTLNRSIAGYVVRECQPVLLDDAFADERFEPGLFVRELQIRGMAAVPIIVQEDAVGVVEVISDRQGAFSLEDMQLLQGLARSAGMAIENASLFGETQQQLRELRLLLQVSEAASSTLTPETVVETIARQLIDALHVNWCTISSWERSDNILIKLAEVAEMVGPVSNKHKLFLADHPAIQAALASGKPFVASAGVSSAEMQPRQVLSGADHCSVLALPISIQGAMVGLIELFHASDQITFSAADIDRSQAVLASWRNAFPADLNWNAPECLQALGRDLIAATGSSWCAVWSIQPNRESMTTIYETGQAIWPVDQGSRSHLEDNSLRRIALMERTAVSARLDDPHLSAGDRVGLSHGNYSGRP